MLLKAKSIEAVVGTAFLHLGTKPKEAKVIASWSLFEIEDRNGTIVLCNSLIAKIKWVESSEDLMVLVEPFK